MVAIIILATLIMWGLSYIAGAAVVERGHHRHLDPAEKAPSTTLR